MGTDLSEGALVSAPPPDAPEEATVDHSQPGLARRLFRQRRFAVAIVVMAVLVLMAVWPGLFTHVGPTDCHLPDSELAPSGHHWFGTDLQGCDVYTRTVHSTRTSLSIGLAVAFLTVVVGGLAGLVAGYFGGAVDALLSRCTDIASGIPLIIGAIVLLSLVGHHGLMSVILTLTLFGWPACMRIMRASVLEAKSSEYVFAAKLLGAGPLHTIRRHIIPNSITPLMLVGATSIGVFITAESVLSFLGIGLQAPTISWGSLASDAEANFLKSPAPLLFPSAFLCLTVLSFVTVADALSDVMNVRVDP
ncbi:ABC transporter permease [Actinoallomurus iriomotensis]|uniref:Peptide ABC transporter permease n=1 Tax=Actinoallomurus iriomotensis TaxID=478107 RepID=A0A9W6RUK7_9ACTN|nr:ABC transporter permease [Actinoallomurus iriomotensis]GLY82141.1 peptide ABC transporter permease [Actinoallomurus iriomotensis]